MKDSRLFSVIEFAKFSRTTRDTLHHYDKVGLLSPIVRGENNYRYYSSGQLAVVNMIRTLQELGMSLAEIKKFKDYRTPEIVDALLTKQITKIDAKIENWINARKLLLTYQRSIHSVLAVDEGAITIQSLPAAPIILGSLNDYDSGRNDYDELLSFYHEINMKHPELDLNYPVWALFSQEQISRRGQCLPKRYYFFNPEGHDARPAARYAVGYTRGRYGQSADLFGRMLEYIEENGFEICGDAYEEYPLNEVSISNDEQYLIRVLMTVRKKQ